MDYIAMCVKATKKLYYLAKTWYQNLKAFKFCLIVFIFSLNFILYYNLLTMFYVILLLFLIY